MSTPDETPARERRLAANMARDRAGIMLSIHEARKAACHAAVIKWMTPAEARERWPRA